MLLQCPGVRFLGLSYYAQKPRVSLASQWRAQPHIPPYFFFFLNLFLGVIHCSFWFDIKLWISCS